MKLVLVSWVDASSLGSSWEDRECLAHFGATRCISVGILAEETDTEVKLVLSLNPVNFSQALAIPKCCIKRIQELKVKCRGEKG